MNRGAYLRVGLLILGGLGLLVGLVVFLAGNRFSEGIAYETYFSESVQGLEVGAAVKFRGVTLGRVTDIGLVSAEYYAHNRVPPAQDADYRLVLVRFLIDPGRVGTLPDTASAIRSGLRARLAQQGITGVSYIELDFAPPGEYPPLKLPWTPRAEYLPSMPSTLSRVQDAAQQFLAKLNGVDIDALMGGLTGLVADLRGEMRDGEIHAAVAQASTLLRTLDEQVREADLPALAADLRRTSTALRDTVQGRDAKAMIANAATAADRLAVAAAKLPALIASLDASARRAGDGTADLQAALGPLLRDLQGTVANLRDTSEQLRRYPAQVLFGGAPPRSADRAR